MASQKPIPIILCGKSETIGGPIIAALLPKYEVTHFILSTEAAVSEIPLILKGVAPATSSSSLGSGRLYEKPKAIMTGGAFDDGAIEEILKAAGKGTPILKVDQGVEMPPVGPEYGKRMIGRAREGLGRLEKEGKLNGGEGGVFLF